MNEIFPVLAAALRRFNAAEAKYGVFDPATDKRDDWQEMEEELLDFINYAAMLVLKLRGRRNSKHEINP